MTTTIATYVGDGSRTEFSFDFDYLRKEFVKVLVDAVLVPFTFHTSQTIKIIPAPAAGKVIIIQRETNRTKLVTFVDGSVLRAGDLNVAQIQAIHIAAEALDAASATLLINSSGDYSAGFRKLADLGDPTDPRDGVNKQWAETAMTSTLGQAITARNIAQAAATDASTAADEAEASEDIAVASKDTAVAAAATATTKAAEATSGAATATTKASEASTDRAAVQALRDEVVLAGATPRTRLISTTGGILGGGDLQTDDH